MVKLELKSFIVFAMALFFCAGAAFGQRQISGIVTDAGNGEPLIGVNILVVGTSVGTITDLDGTYALELPNNATQLQYSYTGYSTLTMDIGASNTIDVRMEAGSVLSEVVVIGYGTVKKEDATGSIQEVGSSSFNRGAINSPQELLAGKVAGVQVTTNSEPGGGATIRIRGGSSLSASNDPLVVIDGVPIENSGVNGSRSPLNLVNPNDIETFTVLKDASATAIYGSRASNGVILITTKKGRLGKKITVDYNGQVSVNQVIKTIDVLNGDQYRELVNRLYDDGYFSASNPARSLMGNADTDWQSEIYQTGIGQDHNLSASGGVGPVPYRVSVGYTDRKGILKTDKFQRMTGAINLSPKFLDNHLQFNANLKGMRNENHFANRDAIGTAARFDPTQPVYFENNTNYGGYYTWLQANGDPQTLAPANPLAQLELKDDNSTVNRYIANGSVDYRFHFLPDLRANLNLGYDYSKGEGTVKVPEFASFSFNNQIINDAQGNPIDTIRGGQDNEYSQTKKNSLLEFYLNYVKDFGKSKLDVMGGYSWQHFYDEESFINRNAARDSIKTTIGEPKPRELYLLSLFGRLNYTLLDRYLFTFTMRRDGTSRFSPDARWGWFPAAALGVKIIDGNGKGAVSNLKLRLGWGITGQQDIGGYYEYLPTYVFNEDHAYYIFGTDTISTLRPEAYDYNIKWEQTTTYNVGVDYGFLDDRIYGSLEFYLRKTSDLLNNIQVCAGCNLSNFVNKNVGDLENRGVELSINAVPIQQKNLTWDLGFNVTANKNEITKLLDQNDSTYIGVLTGGISGGVGSNIQIHSVGYPANSFFVYEQVYDDNGKPIEGLYVDRSGDGSITEDDKYRLEKPLPDFYFGLTSNLSFYNFEFSFAARANVGNYVYNNISSESAYYERIYNSNNYLANVHSDINKLNFEKPQYFSDYYVQNASFLRFDHITLAYNFGNLTKGFANYLKIYATVQNPILITKYKGIDPEIQGGIDNNVYPRSRAFVFGLNASF
ncbi:MAG: TonB-dependent receptor [Saprospiraceae bacterium]